MRVINPQTCLEDYNILCNRMDELVDLLIDSGICDSDNMKNFACDYLLIPPFLQYNKAQLIFEVCALNYNEVLQVVEVFYREIKAPYLIGSNKSIIVQIPISLYNSFVDGTLKFDISL